MNKLAILLAAFSIIWLPLLAVVGARAADASACYNIADGDARSYCLAKARKDASECYNVQRADLRSLCLAEVSK